MTGPRKRCGVVQRNAGGRHEPAQTLPVSQPRCQKLTLRLQTGQLGTVWDPLWDTTAHSIIRSQISHSAVSNRPCKCASSCCRNAWDSALCYWSDRFGCHASRHSLWRPNRSSMRSTHSLGLDLQCRVIRGDPHAVAPHEGPLMDVDGNGSMASVAGSRNDFAIIGS